MSAAEALRAAHGPGTKAKLKASGAGSPLTSKRPHLTHCTDLTEKPGMSYRKQIAAPRHAIDEIVVGDRHRRDLGDIDGLAASIEDIGLLHPITVDEQSQLLAGARRRAACKRLGWRDIPVNVVRTRP